jgi:hypothetical protein
MRDGDKAALDYFSSDEIGDTDNDSMPEILDPWGTPIVFIRWPAGYTPEGLDGWPGIAGTDDDGNGITDDTTELGWTGSDDTLVRTMQTKNFNLAPDPFDPLKIHGNLPSPNSLFPAYGPGYLLHPLIISAGRDKQLDVVIDNMGPDGLPASPYLEYSPQANTNNYPNPYVLVQAAIAGTNGNVPVGTPGDLDNDGTLGYEDNITNHDQTSE